MQSKKKMNYSLTNRDIEEFLGANHIKKYSDLADYDDIDDVFGEDNFVILLIEDHKDSGHWVAILRYDNGTVEQFDPYEGTIDSELKYVPKPTREKLREVKLTLTALLKERKSVSSGYRFQELKKNVDTCGRHIVCRILMFLGGGMELPEYIRWFKMMKKKTGMSGDELVVEFIVPK